MIDMPPPGFASLSRDKPVTIYHRHLPHWRQEGSTYFVTFRLADLLPAARLTRLRDEYSVWKAQNPDPSHERLGAFMLERMRRVEKWLDAGHGECVLRDPAWRSEVENRLRRFDGERYTLGAFAIVPNHVHVAVQPLADWRLEQLDGAWKRFSAGVINRARGKTDRLWQDESFDRIVRDTAHLRRVVRYIEKNIETACGCGTFWLRQDWHEWYYGKERCVPRGSACG